MLHELVYNSIATPEGASDAALLNILASARRENARLGLTGLLFFYRGEFVQLLEGEREAVRHIYYDVIFKDTRHTAPTVCWEHGVAQRSFADWWMAFARDRQLQTLGNAAPDGFLEGGIGVLDLSGPESTGRRMLLALHAQINAGKN